MKIKFIFLIILLNFCLALRPPSVPLVVQDPYISIWSPYNRLNYGFPKHWAGSTAALVRFLQLIQVSMALIDGSCFRIMGPEDMSGNVCPQAMNQIDLQVTPLSTIYKFEANGVTLTLSFTTPAILKQIDILSLPITYVDYEVKNSGNTERKVPSFF